MPIPSVQQGHHQHALLDWSEVVTCPHCQLKSRGRVVAHGYGHSTRSDMYGLDPEGARDRAGIDAFANAVDSAKKMLKHARCPRCGKRGRVVWLVVEVLLGWLLVAAFISAAASTVDLLSPRLSVLGVVAVPVLAALTVLRMLRSADARVRFEPLAELDDAASPAQTRDPVPQPSRPSARPDAPRADPDALELDLDRSWNKNTKD